MKSLGITLAAFVIFISTSASQSTPLVESRLNTALNKAKPDDLIQVAFFLKNPEVSDGNEFVSRLQNSMNSEQTKLMTYLDEHKLRNNALDIKSLWILNAVRARIKKSLFDDIMARASEFSLEYSMLDEFEKISSSPEEYFLQQTALSPLDTCWGLKRMKVFNAWQKGIKGQGVVVAILDTGVDIDQFFQRDQLWINTGETQGNNLDDDGNGYIDDINGFNFLELNDDLGYLYVEPETTLTTQHGTIVASKICGNTTAPITGVAPQAKLMICKITDPALISVFSE